MSTHDHIDLAVAKLHTRAAAALKANMPAEKFVDELVSEGHDPNYAWLIIENVREDIKQRKVFFAQLGMGLFMTGAGILINVFSFEMGLRGGGSLFYLFWGIVVTGIITIIRALLLYRK
jgi:hypothetical protein